jgi:hypothetical protein
VAGEVLGDLADERGRELLVVMLAQLAERPRCRDDDEVGDLPVQHLLVQQGGDPGGEAVLLELAAVVVGGAAVVPPARSLVVARDVGRGQRRQFRVGLVAGVAEQVELLAVRDGDRRSLGQLHAKSPRRSGSRGSVGRSERFGSVLSRP